MRFLLRLSKAIDQLNEWVGRGVAWLTTLMVLLFVYDVVMRYVFNQTFVAIFEIEWHLFAVIFLVGAGFAFRHDRHVRVDLFYTRFSARNKALVNLIGTLLFLVPFCLVGIKYGYDFALNAYNTQEGSPDPGGLPARFLVKSMIPLGLSLLLLQGISLLCKAILTLSNYHDFFSETQPNT